MATLSFQGQGAVITGTVAVDLASVAAGAVTEKQLTISGAAAGDFVALFPPAAGLTAGLCVTQAYVSAADTVKVRVINGSAGTIDESSGTWGYLIVRA
jgi:hypothetical protein